MVTLCPHRRSGFTLVELLVVIVIIGILAGLLIPVLIHAIDQTKVTACGNNLSQLGKMVAVYMSHYRGNVPAAQGQAFWTALQKTSPPLIGLSQNELMFCAKKGEVGAYGTTDYRGPASSWHKLDQGDPLGADLEGNHGVERGGNVLFKDGSVRSVEFDDPLWELARTKLSE